MMIKKSVLISSESYICIPNYNKQTSFQFYSSMEKDNNLAIFRMNCLDRMMRKKYDVFPIANGKNESFF